VGERDLRETGALLLQPTTMFEAATLETATPLGLTVSPTLLAGADAAALSLGVFLM
jgi:hypothetical protein